MPPRRRPTKRRANGAHSARRSSAVFAVILALLVGVNLYVFLWRGGTSLPDVYERAAVAGDATLPGAPDAGAGADQPVPNPLDPAGQAAAKQRGAESDAGTWSDGEVQAGDSLGGILRREGLDAAHADVLIRSLGGAMDLRQIRPGQSYRLHRTGNGTIDIFEFHLSRTHTVRARRDTASEAIRYVVEGVKAATEMRVKPVAASIDSSLFASMIDAGEDPSLVAFFVDVFAYDLNFYIDQHEGDTFRMLVEKEFVNGEFVRYGRVLAAEYSGKAGTFRAFYWQVPGEQRGRYFDEEGRSLEKTFLKTPLKYSRVSSGFSSNRMHPILHVQRGHWGVDYAAPAGTPVWAAAGGRISFRGERGGAGNVVVIEHDGGYSTTYMHLKGFGKGQKVGQYVRPKDVIGFVGATGLATGTHLHFGVKQNGKYIDPLQMKMTRGPGVPNAHKAAFNAHVAGKVAALRIVTPGAAAGVASLLPLMPVPPPVPANALN